MDGLRDCLNLPVGHRNLKRGVEGHSPDISGCHRATFANAASIERKTVSALNGLMM
jgi:hypothetical protein